MSPAWESLTHALLWFALVFVVTGGAIGWVRRWRKQANQPEGATDDLIGGFHDLYEQGALSEQEYQVIRAKLATPTPPATLGKPREKRAV